MNDNPTGTLLICMLVGAALVALLIPDGWMAALVALATVLIAVAIGDRLGR